MRLNGRKVAMIVTAIVAIVASVAAAFSASHAHAGTTSRAFICDPTMTGGTYRHRFTNAQLAAYTPVANANIGGLQLRIASGLSRSVFVPTAFYVLPSNDFTMSAGWTGAGPGPSQFQVELSQRVFPAQTTGFNWSFHSFDVDGFGTNKSADFYSIFGSDGTDALPNPVNAAGTPLVLRLNLPGDGDTAPTVDSVTGFVDVFVKYDRIRVCP